MRPVLAFASSASRYFRSTAEEQNPFSPLQRVEPVKETVGSSVGNKELENRGKSDQAKAGLKDAGEDVKDAVHKVEDATR